MQGDDLTDAEKERILRVGVFYDDAMERKRQIFDEFWSAMPESEAIWYRHSDPPAHDPLRNRIATIRQLEQDHVVVLFETETEAGYPAERGYNLRPASGHWRIASAVDYREEVCKLVPPPASPFDEEAGLAAYYPDPAAIARARRMLETLHVDPLVQALEEHGGDFFAALRSVGAEFQLDRRGACTLLSLAHTAVTDKGLARLATLTDLQELYLGPRITDAGLAHLAGMTRLKMLGFHEGNDYPQVTGSGLAHLAGMSGLERLDLGRLPLTDEGMARMSGPAGLRELLVYNTGLTDTGLASLATLPSLEELHAHDTMVRGPGLARLAAPECLRVLDLARTPVDDAGLAYLSGLTGLVELDLSETNVTDAGLKHLAGLSNLKDLALPDGVTAQGRAWLSAALPGCRSEGAGEAAFPGAVCDATVHPKLMAMALNDGFRLDHFLGGLVVRVEDAGGLSLPSGQVVACDPGYLEHPDLWPPFARAVPPGRYPVRVGVVHLDRGAVRVALAALILDPAPPVRFELATRPGEDAATLGPGESFGHGVDSGTSCFLDFQAAREVHERCQRWDRHRQGSQPELSVGRDRHWANSVLDPATGLNMVMFPSGIGDGRYSSYWGFDAADRLVCLVTDFELLAGGEAYFPRCPECGAGEGEPHLKFPCDAERAPSAANGSVPATASRPSSA